METIYIYNGENRISVPVTDSAERSHSLQQHNYVKLVWKSAENTPISANAYIEYEGQVFYCLDDYFPTHKEGIYEYDIEFHAIEDTFNRPLFFRYVDILDQTIGETTSWKEIEWSLNSNLRTIAEIVVDSLNRAYDNAYFALPNDSYADTLLLSYSFASNSIADALSTIAEQNETEWWLETTDEYVDGKRKYILHFDKCELGDTIELNDNYTEDANGVWQSGGLKSVSQSGNTNIIPQKLYVYGSERNIIKKTVEQEVAGGVMNVSYNKKLRLPKRLANNTTIYPLESVGKLLYLNEDSSITISGINNKFEQVKIFDEVYPKMDMTVKGVSVQNPNSENPIYWLKGDRLKSITTENPADDSINPGKLGLLIEGCTLMCTFTSGVLNGREFECSWRESSAEIGLIPIDENDVQIPSGVFKPQEGDTFILWNLAMPQSSIDIAQKELLTEAINYIEELVTSITETDCTTEAEATRISGLNTKIKVGQRISVNSNVFRNGRLSSRIINFSYKLTKPYDISFTLASSRQTGRLATLQNLIADVTHEVHSVGQVQRAISRRQWHDTEEMMSMLDSIQKQLVVVGDENNAFTTTCNVELTNAKVKVSNGYIQHQSYTENEWKGAWMVASEFEYAFTKDDANTPFYLYFKCNKNDNSAMCGIGSALPQETDEFYVLNLGIISSEYEGERVFNQSSGLTSIAGGTITTDVVQDPSRRLIIDYANAIIRARKGAQIIGKITFVDDEENEQSLSDSLGSLLEGMELAQSEAEQAKTDASQAKEDAKEAQEKASDAYNRDNTNIMLKTKELGFSPASVAYHFKTMELTEKLKPNTKYVFSVEKSEVTAGSATEFEFTIIKSDYTTKKVTKYIPISSEKQEVAFTTPSTILGSDVVIIYAGRGGATANVGLKLTKFKLEQGNKATAWTPAPEDVTKAIADAEDRTMEALANEVETINGGIEALQKQVDGEVTSWFLVGAPTLTNAPAKDWTTDEEKLRHEGDTYTNINSSVINNINSVDIWEQGSTINDTIGKTYEEIKSSSVARLRSKTIFKTSNARITIEDDTWNFWVTYYDSNGICIEDNSGYKTSINIDTNYAYFSITARKGSGSDINVSDIVNVPISIEGDINFGDPTGGQSWRWCNVDDEYGNGWHWHKIADNDAVQALAKAGEALATADGKSTTFVVQPSNYSKGDLWILQSDTAHTAGKKGDILTANEASVAYVASHWSKEVKYTDDTAVENLQIGGRNILRNSKELQFALASSSNNYNYITYIPTVPLSPNTDYVFSVEKSELLAGTATLFSVIVITKEYGAQRNAVKLNISNNKQFVKFTTPSSTLSTDVVIIYNGVAGATGGNQLKISNFKLEQGNKATAWTPAPEDVDENIQKSINNIQIGGTNLLPNSKPRYLGIWNGNGATVTFENGVIKGLVSGAYPKIWNSHFKDFTFENGKEYTLSFMARSSVNGTRSAYIGNSSLTIINFGYFAATTEWQRFELTAKCTSTGSSNWDTGLYIYCGATNNASSGQWLEIKEVQLERGNKATAWKENEADIIEARTNIVKEGMMKKVTNNSFNIVGTLTLSESIKTNTEYVFSIERADVETDIKLYNGSTLVTTIKTSTKNAVHTIVIFDTEDNGVYLLTNTGTCNVFGVKLAEGNKYVGYEATPEEKDTIMKLQTAMKGTTDIIGGLVMTNLIGLKDEGNDIQAGISGLSDNFGNLRFWAGAGWSDSQKAPFRVYDNGNVHAGSFYGFNGAFIINNDNIGDLVTITTDEYNIMYFEINYRLTGSYVYIDNIANFISNKEAEYGSGFGGFKMPKEIFYVGASLEILNPYGYMVAYNCSEMPLKKQCNLSNFAKSDTLANIGSVQSAILDSNSKYFRWSVIPNVCSPMIDAYFKFQAIAAKVPSGKSYSTALHKWKIKGNSTLGTNGTYQTTSECLFMRWIIVERSNGD